MKNQSESSENNKKLQHLDGIIKNIVFRNEKNAFTVLNLASDDKIIRVVGALAPVQPGDEVRLEGKWENHEVYGKNFKVSSFEVHLPTSKKGILAFLKSGHINGIGPKMAKEIVETFGNNTIDILEKHPERLKELPNIGKKRLKAIQTGWQAHKNLRNSLLFLQGLGISKTLINQAMNKLGEHAAVIIRNDPYSLTVLPGIGFLRADRFAMELGIEKESDERIAAGILYAIGKIISEGHCYAPYEILIEKTKVILGISNDLIDAGLEKLIKKGRLLKDLPKNIFYRPDLERAELNIATHLKMLKSGGLPFVDNNKALSTALLEKEMGLIFSRGQRQAIESVFKSKVSIITGGPGTGKTTIIKAIILQSEKFNLNVLLAAPTGRAAQRLKESTGINAKTIHRLLEYNPAFGGFSRDAKNPLEAEIIIIDEASMVDVFLMSALMQAIPANCTLILVGDIDQLPSVGPGNILRDLIHSEQFNVVTLREIFRQAAQSLIITNAHRINRGETIILPAETQSNADFYFIERTNPAACAQTVQYVVTKRLPSAFNLNPFKDIQVITPMHQGETGTKNLNLKLQLILNPHKTRPPVEFEAFPFQVGDKVMQTKNNYELGTEGVFNGDIGFVVSINFKTKKLIVSFDENIEYSFNDLHDLTLAYAITVHKSQGSEYPVVVLPLLTQHYMLLQRNLLYTALTRAKKIVIVVGSKKAINMAISNNKTQKRFTGLKEKLNLSSI